MSGGPPVVASDGSPVASDRPPVASDRPSVAVADGPSVAVSRPWCVPH